MGVGDPYRYRNDHENRGVRQSGRLCGVWLCFCDWSCQAPGNIHKARYYLAPNNRQTIRKEGWRDLGTGLNIFMYICIWVTETGLTAMETYDIDPWKYHVYLWFWELPKVALCIQYPSHVTSPLTAQQAPHSQAALFTVKPLNKKYGYAHRLELCLIVVAVCIVLLPPQVTTKGAICTLGIIKYSSILKYYWDNLLWGSRL